jgi:hypothetical protein
MTARSSRMVGGAAVAMLVAACSGMAEDVGASSDEVNAAAPDGISRGGGGELRLKTPLPARVSDCPSGSSCADADHDGLVDAWEDSVLDQFKPAVTFDEDEPLLKEDGRNDVFASLGRVSLRADGRVTVNVLLLYTRDYGAPNPICFSASQHAGDVERVAIDLELAPSAPGRGDAIVRSMFTTGHEGTEDDQSRVYRGDDLKSLETIDDPVTKRPRWRVYASQAKHATYATKKHCEGVRLKNFLHRFCVNEDCAADGVSDNDKARFTRVPRIDNAGEPNAHRVEDLRALGYPGETSWTDTTFCGGLNVDRAKEECPPSVKSKLLADPFVP